ncbi:hypothetical protein ACFL2Q_03065 [Thermodesulfobacteriota bacterium]
MSKSTTPFAKIEAIRPLLVFDTHPAECKVTPHRDALPELLPDRLDLGTMSCPYRIVEVRLANFGGQPMAYAGCLSDDPSMVVPLPNLAGVTEIPVPAHGEIIQELLVRVAGRAQGQYGTEIFFQYGTEEENGVVVLPLCASVEPCVTTNFDVFPRQLHVDRSQDTASIECANHSDTELHLTIVHTGLKDEIPRRPLKLGPRQICMIDCNIHRVVGLESDHRMEIVFIHAEQDVMIAVPLILLGPRLYEAQGKERTGPSEEIMSISFP